MWIASGPTEKWRLKLILDLQAKLARWTIQGTQFWEGTRKFCSTAWCKPCWMCWSDRLYHSLQLCSRTIWNTFGEDRSASEACLPSEPCPVCSQCQASSHWMQSEFLSDYLIDCALLQTMNWDLGRYVGYLCLSSCQCFCSLICSIQTCSFEFSSCLSQEGPRLSHALLMEFLSRSKRKLVLFLSSELAGIQIAIDHLYCQEHDG